jgi:signal transduction histidine kinase
MNSLAIGPLAAQLTHQPFPLLAEALRSESDRITRAWDVAVRESMPQMRRLTFEELSNSTPQILIAIADALASDDPKVIRELVHTAPHQGLSRLELNFDVLEVMQEDRLLRAIIVEHVEAALIGRMDAAEAAALHAAIDVMLQKSVIALVDKQKAQLRDAAETELKFLSFLSHDLNNTLGGVTLWLAMLAEDLRRTGGFPEAENSLGHARNSIDATITGMRRMLDHERMRKSGTGAKVSSVNLSALAAVALRQFIPAAEKRGLTLITDVPAAMTAVTDPELLMMVLQNLIGNAVKFSRAGTIRVGCDGAAAWDPPRRLGLFVSDEGPGIAPEQVGRIFEAFKRGDGHGEQGLGLGLAIASQAAKLLGADLTVESVVGAGSTFRLLLPERAAAANPRDDTHFRRIRGHFE